MNEIVNADSLEYLNQLDDNSIDLVLTDPPYGYLDTKFDKEYFDTENLFSLLYKKCKDNSFLVFFGKGIMSYKQALMAEQCGFTYKDTVVWDKVMTSNPFGVFGQRHEIIFIFAKGNKVANKYYIKASEHYSQMGNSASIRALERFLSSWRSNKEGCIKYLDTGVIDYNKKRKAKSDVTVDSKLNGCDKGIQQLKSFTEGVRISSIIRVTKDSVYDNIHPTQKPVKLLEILLHIFSNEKDFVVDPFSGSGSTAVACNNMGRNFICIEKDREYYERSIARIKSVYQESLF